MVDTIFADVAQPDQARIVAINAHHFLKNGGNFVISIKVCASRLYMYVTGSVRWLGITVSRDQKNNTVTCLDWDSLNIFIQSSK